MCVGVILTGAFICAFRPHHGPSWRTIWEWIVRDGFGAVSSLRVSPAELEWIVRATRWTPTLSRRSGPAEESPFSSSGRIKSTSPHEAAQYFRKLFTLCLWAIRRSDRLASSARTLQRVFNVPARPPSVVAISAGVVIVAVSVATLSSPTLSRPSADREQFCVLAGFTVYPLHCPTLLAT